MTLDFCEIKPSLTRPAAKCPSWHQNSTQVSYLRGITTTPEREVILTGVPVNFNEIRAVSGNPRGIALGNFEGVTSADHSGNLPGALICCQPSPLRAFRKATRSDLSRSDRFRGLIRPLNCAFLIPPLL